MVVVTRRRQAQQGLKQPVEVRRGKQVPSAHHIGHALRRIVNNNR